MDDALSVIETAVIFILVHTAIAFALALWVLA